jgi:Flp pilus assembly protein TadG
MTPRVGAIDDEAGQVTAFVVVITLALLFAAGLVLDGGTILSTKRQAMYDAEQAARAGAQGLQVEQVHAGASGSSAADPDRARDQAVAYLNRIGRSDYSISVSDDSVTVTVRIQRDLQILPGGPKTMVGTSTARAVRGVGAPET